MKSSDLSQRIDHTLLAAGARSRDVRRLCAEAKRFGFRAVCVNPVWVPLAARLLKGSGVRVASVCGFPLGAMTTAAKAFEARAAVRAGASEIDMVMNIGEAKAGNWTAVFNDIRRVRRAAKGKTLKVILETGLLTKSEMSKSARTAVRAGADFVKTSTGFGPRGASLADIRILARALRGAPGAGRGPKARRLGRAVGRAPGTGRGPKARRLGQIKASGGIRTRRQALRFIRAGADRLGTSASVAILTREK